MSLKVHRHGQVGASVVGVIEYCDLATASVLAGNLYCILNRFGSGVKQR